VILPPGRLDADWLRLAADPIRQADREGEALVDDRPAADARYREHGISGPVGYDFNPLRRGDETLRYL
jgi:hypothetical protein